jgi:leishmanolysin-like peptidase
VAYAAHCQQESALDRPVAGHTNVCPSALHESPSGGPRLPEIVESLTATVKHELLHALGFSSSLFAFYRDKDGQPLTERGADGKPPINEELQLRQWSDKVVKQVNTWLS